jgi:hypothetical protein
MVHRTVCCHIVLDLQPVVEAPAVNQDLNDKALRAVSGMRPHVTDKQSFIL